MALKKCKDCGAEVSSSAKKCPKCGNKLKGGMLGKIVIGIIILGIIGGIASNVNGGNSNSNTPEEVNIGETITSSKLEVTVTKVSQRNSVGNDFFSSEASQDSKFVVVEWKYKNVSDKAMSGAWDSPELVLINSEGVEYEESLKATTNYRIEKDIDNKLLENINYGITVEQASVFEIPVEALEEDGWKIKTDVSKTLIVID